MFQLPRITWIRFGIWMLAGLVIYFVYAFRHSVIRTGKPPGVERPGAGH